MGRNCHRSFQPPVSVRPGRQAGILRERQLFLRWAMRLFRNAAGRLPAKNSSGISDRGLSGVRDADDFCTVRSVDYPVCKVYETIANIR